MKNKNYRLLSLLLALPLVLSGCGGQPSTSSEQAGSQPAQSESQPAQSESQPAQSESQPAVSESSEAAPVVTGVTIAYTGDKTVLDGTRATLKASVAGDEGVSQKVTWDTSDNTVATVTNGVVNFLKVSEEKKVTITATSVADSNFKATVEFTVEHSPFDLKNSRGGPDTSCYLEDGQFIVEDPQDIALVYADVHATRWYVEATIEVDEFDPTDAYPKFGIMASEREDGMWCYEQSHQFFYYVDTVAAAQSWSAMNVVTEDKDLVNWDWSHQISPATASPAAKKQEAFKMGLMRDGNKFYQFYGAVTDVTLKCVGTFEYDSFGENANYVWVGGWKTAAVISDPKALVGDEIDTLYEVPEGISLNSASETLYLGDSYQLKVTAEGLWDRNKLEFASSDAEIATVSEKGLVTAGQKAGTATITASIKGTELSAEFELEVTDDQAFKVILDGKMDDLIWSETVKANNILLKSNAKNYIRIYAAKNSRGVYAFMDYTVSALKNEGSDGWWKQDNVEFYLADNDLSFGGQYWLSVINGGSFVSVGSNEKAEAIFYKPLTLGEDELYHGAFELFVPYGDDNVTKGEATYACFGFNPASGWANTYNWRTATVNPNTLQITENGFVHDGTSCSEGHAYGNWVVDAAATCNAAGSAHRDCAFCGHQETKVLDIDPNAHNFDYEHAVVTTAPTCVSTGIGTATCTLCGDTDETVLPIDPTNHAGEYQDGMYTCCHVMVKNGETLTLDKTDSGGWTSSETDLVRGIEGDKWTYEYEYDLTTNGIAGNWWRGVLPWFKAAEGDIAVARFDWWGWVDDRNGDGQSSISGKLKSFGDGNDSISRNTEWYKQKDGGVPADFETCMTASHVRAVVVRDGNKINSTFYIKCESIDFTYEYHFDITGVTTEAVTLGISAEFAKAIVTNVRRVA